MTIISVESELSKIKDASRHNDGVTLAAMLYRDSISNIVTATWTVTYDKLGNDIIVEARVGVANPVDCLLQVWLMDQHPGIWIPELRPWISTVIEFSAQDQQQSVHIALLDSKWRAEDSGQTYKAFLWGYVQQQKEVKKFFFEKDFVYP